MTDTAPVTISTKHKSTFPGSHLRPTSPPLLPGSVSTRTDLIYGSTECPLHGYTRLSTQSVVDGLGDLAGTCPRDQTRRQLLALAVRELLSVHHLPAFRAEGLV